MSTTTLVLGIGNNLLTDEGIGIHVVSFLAAHHADEPGVEYLDGGTLSFTLAEPIAAHDNLIVIDAARLGLPPGSVRCLEGGDMDRYLTGNRQSVHEVGLTDLLDIARLSDTLPQRRALIGIEPESLDWGERLSATLRPAVREAAERVLTLVRNWRGTSDGAN